MKNVKIIPVFLFILIAAFYIKSDLMPYSALNNCNESENKAECYCNLSKQYNKDNNTRYNCGFYLLQAKRYDEALEHFKYIAENEKNSNFLIKNSKIGIKEIEYYKNEQQQIQLAQKRDIGHYYSDLDQKYRFKDPKNIKVYIKSKTGRENILTNALKTWDDALYSMVDFKFTDDEKNADITILLTTIQDVQESAKNKQAIGVTSTESYYSKNKTYIKNATVKVSVADDNNNLRSDAEILGIALHEIGHALGIMSHSPQKGDIMYFNASSYQASSGTISNRDINTIKKIYGNI